MIIVEGTDNTGKTSLVRRLTEEIPDLVYQGRSPGHCREMVVKIADEFLVKRPHETLYNIYDRILFSEIVYNRATGRPDSYFTDGELQAIMEGLKDHRPFMILCSRSSDKLSQTFLASEHQFDINVVLKARLLYHEEMRKYEDYFWDGMVYSWDIDQSPPLQKQQFDGIVYHLKQYLSIGREIYERRADYMRKARDISREMSRDGQRIGYGSSETGAGSGHAGGDTPLPVGSGE